MSQQFTIQSLKASQVVVGDRILVKTSNRSSKLEPCAA